MALTRERLVQKVHDVQMRHHQERPPNGDCICGLRVPLGHPFQNHVAEEIVDAVLEELNIALAPMIGEAT